MYSTFCNNCNLQVATAVRFLENPKVAKSSEQVKRAFLSKKGLTKAEIDESFVQARPSQPQISPTVTGPNPIQSQMMVPYYGRWQLVRDIGNLSVLIIGAAYGINYLWQVRPHQFALILK